MSVAHSIIQKSQLEGAHRLDAEYYQPEYLESQNKLAQWPTSQLIDVAKVSDGNHGSISESFSATDGVRYLRGKDLNDFFVSDDNPIYIPESEYLKIKRSHIFKEDVLVSIVGTVGLVSIVADDFDKLTGNCKIAILRTKKVDPWFLSAFLVSRYGQNQIRRKVAGAVQTGIILQDLSSVLVPDVSQDEQKKVREIVESSYREQIRSENLYSQAENLLLEELGLKDFKVEDDLSYIVNLSDVKSAHRADAEYFQPKYDKLVERIKSKNAKALGELVSMKKGIEPGAEAYQDEGRLFIRVSSLSKYGIEDKDQKYLSKELYQKLKNNQEPKIGEILLTKDATPGIAYVVKGQIEGIISSGILRLKVKDKEIENEYLALCLNSIVGQMQAERDGGGSIITHWRPEQVKSVFVPILPKPTQQKIADLVQKSHEARSKAKQLLAKAKNMVETLIEV